MSVPDVEPVEVPDDRPIVEMWLNCDGEITLQEEDTLDAWITVEADALTEVRE